MKSIHIMMTLLLLCAFGCTQEVSRVRAKLDRAEACMDAYPDSALVMLRSVDMDALPMRRDRARAALLHSIALDKSYIDITSDSIIAPALAFYRSHGSALQRLKSRYYRSVISRNAGDRDTQMAWLVEAEKYISRARNPEMAGFIYAAKRTLYLDLLDVDNAEINARLAVSAYDGGVSIPRYLNAVKELALILQMKGDYSESSAWIDTLMNNSDLLSRRQLSSLFVLRMGQVDSSQIVLIPDLINSYLSEFNDGEHVFWLNVAEAWRRAGYSENARSALERYSASEDFNPDDPAFWLVSHRVFLDMQDFERSDACHRRYSELVETRRHRAIKSDARFIDAPDKRRISPVIVAVLLLMAVLLVLLSVVFSKPKSNPVQEAPMTSDHDAYSPEFRKKYADFIETYGKYLYSKITHQEPQAESFASTLLSVGEGTEREELLSFILDLFRYNHPDVYNALRALDLTKTEYKISVLLSMGIPRKETGSLLGLSPEYVYKVCKSIRRKMSLENRRQSLENALRQLDKKK